MPQPSNPYLGLVAQYAQQAGIDPKWAQATLLTENTPGDPRAVSPAGAVGLMQVMPANAAGANLADPMANIQRGVQILAANLKAAGGDKSKASAMYFDGPNAKTFGPGAYSYVKKVADNYNSLGTPDMNQPSATSQTPWIDSQLSQAQNEMAAPNSAPPPAQTAAATPWIDSQMAQTQKDLAAQQSAAQAQGGIGANMRAGIEDVLIRPGLALDNALNGTAVGGFLQRHNILATPEQDEATYARDTSNLGTTLPDQAARFAGEAATAAPVLAAGGEALGAAAGAAGAGLDAAGAGTAANVTRGAGQLVTGNAGQWGAGVGQGAVRLASMSANGAAQGAGFNALTGRSPVAGAEIGAAANPLLDGALHAVAAGGEAALDSARPATQAAAAKISRALGRDGMTPTQLISNMEAMGPEATAADAGGQNVLRTADAVAVKPGASTAIAQQTLSQRAAERVDRLVSTAQTATGQTGTVHGTIDQLIAQRSADAAPLFQWTFQRMQPTADEIGKLQPLISSPEGQTALKTGLTIMRRSALGAGQPFDASEIGVTQLPNGQLGVAPDAQTMPLLHAIKEGFDDNVESLRDPVTGKLPNTKEVNALASMRDFYRSTLTNMYPRYASALQAWAGPSAAIDAVRMGRQAMNNDPEVTGKVVSAMPDSLKEFYLQGVTRQLTDKMQANPAATVNQVLKNRVLQNKIAAAFPTPEAYQDFITTLQNEARMMKTENLVNQGSQTAARGHAIEDLSSPLAHTAFALRDALAGSPGGAAYNAGRVIGHLAKGASPADDEMGLLLFTPGNTDELENLLMPKTGAAQKALATGVKGAGKLIGTAATGARLYGAPSQVQFNALTGNPQ